MTEHILHSYVLDGKGGGTPMKDEKISSQTKGKKLTWINIDAKHPDTKKWLQQELEYLDPFIIEALLEDGTRPRMTQIDDGILLILRGVNLNEGNVPEDMVSARLWVDEHRIITIRKRKLKAIKDIEKKIKSGKGPCHSGDFICMLISRLFQRMGPTLTDLDEATDDIEEKILETADSCFRESIINIRKEAILLRRYMAPQRDAIGVLKNCDIEWLTDTNKRQLNEEYNHVIRYVEDLDEVRERAQVVKDELSNMLADRLNRNMYVLSVIAAIFLPLGFLTGLVGVNLGGIPGTQEESAFAIFSIFLILLVLVQVIIFKKLKWF